MHQRLSLENEHALHFSNFPITGLCNSYANSWLDRILFSMAPPGTFLSKSL